MTNKYLNTIFFAVLIIVALVLQIPTIALHTFQPDTCISTTGSDLLAEANSTETITITINITNVSYDYLNQTNITVPVNSTDYANYSIDWSTLVILTNWTCTNETDSSGNISKIMCDTTTGNETQEFNISFSATAYNFNDSSHTWTISTTDNNSETNTTTFTTKIGIVPTLSAPNPVNGTVMTQYFGNFSVNVTDPNLNTTSSLIFFRNQTNPVWRNQSLLCSGISPSYICSGIVNLASYDGETLEYYFSAADTYAGTGYNWTNTSYLNVTVNISEPEKIPYIILMPLQSMYYNQSYDLIGTKMNATINNNSYVYTEGIDLPHYYSIPDRATIIYFDESTIDISVDNSLVEILAAYEPEYVTVILHPEYVTPDMIRKLNTLFSSIDDDPFVDVAWGIVTGKSPADAQSLIDRSLGTVSLNTTTYNNYYTPESLQFTGSSVFAPLEQAYQSAATFISNILNPAGSNNIYLGSSATGANMFNSIVNSADSIIYFAGGGTNKKMYMNTTNLTDIFYDEYSCPFTSTSDDVVSCWDNGILNNFKNNILFFSTSDYFARISRNDTNENSWDLGNKNSSDWNYQDSVILKMLTNSNTLNGPHAFIGSTSVSWLTSESVAKHFFLNVLEGKDIGSSLAASKNRLVLNRDKIENQTAKDFISAIEDSYVLYGIPQISSGKNIDYIDYIETSLLQTDMNPSTGDTISWNQIITLSPSSDISPIYSDNVWQPTYGSVWYKNVTVPSTGKINITFIAALYGEYLPDNTAFNLSVAPINTQQKDLTQMTIMVERTIIDTTTDSTTEQYNQSETLVSNSKIMEDDFKYMLNNKKSVVFAIPYSPNTTLYSSHTTEMNLTFITEGVSIETLSVLGHDVRTNPTTGNNITEQFSLSNPTQFTISNLTIKYPVPTETIYCNVSGLNLLGPCIILSGFALQNISSLPSGRTLYAINYTVDANMITKLYVVYDDEGMPPRGFIDTISVFNYGDNLTINTSIYAASAIDAKIFTEIFFVNGSKNTIVWSNSTVSTIGVSETFIDSTFIDSIWPISANQTLYPKGKYLIKLYALENETSDYIFKKTIYINITDGLDLTISQTAINKDSIDKYLAQETFNFTFTGTVKKKTGKPLNKTVIGVPSVKIYFDNNLVGSAQQLSDENGNMDDTNVNITNPSIGNHTIMIKVFDEFNNIGEKEYFINITNEINSITLNTNATDSTANEEDWITISGSIEGTNNTKVFDAAVNLYIDGAIKANTTSDENGDYSFIWQVPYGDNEKNYNISVDGTSPLNTTKTILNSTNLHIVWLDVTIDPTLPDIGITSTVNISKDVTVTGSVKYSDDMDNESLIDNADITCLIRDLASSSWNDSKYYPDAVNSYGEYSCLFSNLNHTGTYYVKISATHTIDSRVITGYTYQTFKIIYIAPYTDSSSGSTSPSGSLTPSSKPTDTKNNTTDTIETTDNLDIKYNKLIVIKQGTTEYIELTVTNKKTETIYDLYLTLDGVTWSNWYNIINADIVELAPNASATFMVDLNAPDTAQVNDYTINARLTANETDIDETVSFTLKVSFSDTNKIYSLKQLDIIETQIYQYNERIKALISNISDPSIFQKYVGALNATVVGTAKDKIFEAKKLIDESRSLLEAGNTFEALKLKDKAESVIREAEQLISVEESKLSKISSLFKKVLLASFFFIVLIAVLGYMLIPPKVKGTYTPKGDFFNQKIKKKTTLHSFSFKKGTTQKIDNKQERASNNTPIGRTKIDLLHERFKSHLKEHN